MKMLQRKNVELSSLVRKLDEKNQQLATRNAELVGKFVVMCEEPAVHVRTLKTLNFLNQNISVWKKQVGFL